MEQRSGLQITPPWLMRITIWATSPLRAPMQRRLGLPESFMYIVQAYLMYHFQVLGNKAPGVQCLTRTRSIAVEQRLSLPVQRESYMVRRLPNQSADLFNL